MQFRKAFLCAGLLGLVLLGCRSNRNEITQNADDQAALEAQVKAANDRVAAAEDELKRKETESKEAMDKLKADLLGFSIQYKHSSKCLEVENASQADGARMRQQPCNFSNVQKFRLIERPGGNWIQNLLTGKCIASQGSGMGNGTPVVQAACTDASAMLHMLESDGNGYFFIRNLGSNRCIDIEAISQADGAAAQLYDCVAGDAQRVKIMQSTP